MFLLGLGLGGEGCLTGGDRLHECVELVEHGSYTR